jgi:hypothetical protein
VNHAPASDQDTPAQEAARIRHTRVQLARARIAALRACVPFNHRDNARVRALLAIDLDRITSAQLHDCDVLTWDWRRRPGMPRHLAPTLNPNDPIVKGLAV